MEIKFTGSDVILLNEFPKQLPLRKIPYILGFRFLIWLSKRFCERYFADHDHLIPEIKQFGIDNVSVSLPKINKIVYSKVRHKGFNVLYYRPITKHQDWTDWIYGYDIYTCVNHFFCNSVNWIIVDGTQDMSQIYPVTDFYLRCNRHDGAGRMRLECEINDIPYYWSYEDPSVFEIVEKIKILKNKKQLI